MVKAEPRSPPLPSHGAARRLRTRRERHRARASVRCAASAVDRRYVRRFPRSIASHSSITADSSAGSRSTARRASDGSVECLGVDHRAHGLGALLNFRATRSGLVGATDSKIAQPVQLDLNVGCLGLHHKKRAKCLEGFVATTSLERRASHLNGPLDCLFSSQPPPRPGVPGRVRAAWRRAIANGTVRSILRISSQTTTTCPTPRTANGACASRTSDFTRCASACCWSRIARHSANRVAAVDSGDAADLLEHPGSGRIAALAQRLLARGQQRGELIELALLLLRRAEAPARSPPGGQPRGLV